MRQLTPRQKQILELIQDFINEFGMPPTRAEIAALGRKVDRLTRVVGGTEASSSKKRKTTKRKTTKTGAKTTRAKKAVRKTKAKPARGRTS